MESGNTSSNETKIEELNGTDYVKISNLFTCKLIISAKLLFRTWSDF